jgi:energy-coupling factor transporter transmembrane protein EcfT
MDSRLKLLMMILSSILLFMGIWMFLIPIPWVLVTGACMVFVAGYSIIFWATRKKNLQ